MAIYKRGGWSKNFQNRFSCASNSSARGTVRRILMCSGIPEEILNQTAKITTEYLLTLLISAIDSFSKKGDVLVARIHI
jgi:hypothetical protein